MLNLHSLISWILALVIGLLAYEIVAGTRSTHPAYLHTEPRKLALGVLGDSDSHSYHDSINNSGRGGTYRGVALQWTEILARLRGNQLDLGEWGVWGSRGSIAELKSIFGFEGRAPKKQDFKYNFAWSGAQCNDLTEGRGRQVQRLIRLMNKERSRWDSGIIVLRIGVNSLGKKAELDEYAESGLSQAALAKIDACVGYIHSAVNQIRAASDDVRLVIVGMFDNTNWVPYINWWRSQKEIRNIRQILDAFDHELYVLAEKDRHATFMDDRMWWSQYWGDRDSNGIPAYKTVNLGGTVSVSNAQGDHPQNAIIADGHAGTVWNGLWAKELIATINNAFHTGIEPLLEPEIARLVDPNSSLGIAPRD